MPVSSDSVSYAFDGEMMTISQEGTAYLENVTSASSPHCRTMNGDVENIRIFSTDAGIVEFTDGFFKERESLKEIRFCSLSSPNSSRRGGYVCR